MLSKRILSAVILVPLVIWAVLALDTTRFALAVLLAVLPAAWEWSALVPLRGNIPRGLYVLATAVLVATVWRFAGQERLVDLLLWVALAWWLIALFWITHPDAGRRRGLSSLLVKAVVGWLLLVSTWLALVVLHSRPDHGPEWVLFVLALVWVADSGAYFAGRQWGRRKLAPQVSPGKSWEGVYGALAACAVYALLIAWALGVQGRDLASFLLVCLLTVLFSIAGDLLESLMKRQQDVKDSGTLIPGHGGVLDRIDSLLAAVPIFTLGLRWVDL